MPIVKVVFLVAPHEWTRVVKMGKRNAPLSERQYGRLGYCSL